MLTIISLLLLGFIIVAGYEMTKDAPTTQDLPRSPLTNAEHEKIWESIKVYCQISDEMLETNAMDCLIITRRHGFEINNKPLSWSDTKRRFILRSVPTFSTLPKEFLTQKK